MSFQSPALGLILHSFLVFGTTGIQAHETPHVSADAYQPPRKSVIVGEGEFRFRYLPGWGSEAAAKLSLGNCHAMVVDGSGRLYLANTNPEYGIVVLDEDGRLLDRWGDFAPQAHGLTLSVESGEEFLYITTNDTNGSVFKTTLSGKILLTIPSLGGNPRDIVFYDDHIVVPHLGDNWPEDRNAAGFISFLGRDFNVVANLGGRSQWDDKGELVEMQHDMHLFHHPHGIVFDQKGDLYVAQFASNGSFPLKFERIRELR